MIYILSTTITFYFLFSLVLIRFLFLGIDEILTVDEHFLYVYTAVHLTRVFKLSNGTHITYEKLYIENGVLSKR